MTAPDILGAKADYNTEATKAYNEQITQKMSNEQQKNTEKTQEEIENLKILSISKVIKEAIYDSNVTKSSYQFTDQETYTNTDFNDKTDTYINMNTSFRYIKYNIDGAGTLYNQLNEGNDFKKDSPKKVFESIKNRFVTLGFNKKVNEQGKLETFEIKNDTDMLYMIGFFQSMTENKSPNASKKDFRIGPKTLSALVDDNNKLEHPTRTKIETQPEEKLEPMPKIETETISQSTASDKTMETRPIITPEEKLEPMPKIETDMNITQNTASDKTMETRPIITPEEKLEPMPKIETKTITQNTASNEKMETRPIITPREKLEPMPKIETKTIAQNTASDETMETRPIITPEEKLEPMPKIETKTIAQNTASDETMETRPIITPEKVEMKENKELQINDFFDPITDWTDKIAPRVKSENMGNRMVRETARNRTDKERNKDSEKFIENWVKEGSIIIDIGSALGNRNPLYAGITTQELYNNENILNKTQGNIIAVDLDDRGNKEIRENNVKNKKAYNIKVEWVDKSLGFMTPVEDIVKKYGTEKNPIIIRSANGIDMLMTEEEALKHLEYIASSLKNYEVTYIFNKYILYKTNNSTKFSIIGEVNEAGFDHQGNKWSTNKDRIPYTLNEKGKKIDILGLKSGM